MKKLLYLLLLLLVGCSDFNPTDPFQDIAEKNFQACKFECVNETLAIKTNFYGMGEIMTTRTTDGGNYSNWDKMYQAYLTNPLTEAEPLDEAWWVLLENTNIECPHNNRYEGRIDMPGFNTGDQSGKCVFINASEQTPNCSNCSNQLDHQYYKLYKTDGHYLFVEIHATSTHIDGTTEDVICKVYATFEHNPAKSYMICIEDLGGSLLDYNDMVILGGENMKPRIIYRAAALPMTIIADNKKIEIPGNQFGDFDIELDINNMNTPNSWKNVQFIAHQGDIDIEIPILLKEAKNQPAVIATEIIYQFHRDENTMKESEFLNIPFYGM